MKCMHLVGALLAFCFSLSIEARVDSSVSTVPLKFSGGHETDPQDGGRPVVLIAHALGVPPEVFRQAFRRVTPAKAGGEPQPAPVRRNKEVLLQALAPYGISNEQLDRVSDYYRYRPGGGRLWRGVPAETYATIVDGTVTKIVVTNPGAGYSSEPSVSIVGHPALKLTAQVLFSRELNRNGAIGRVSITASP